MGATREQMVLLYIARVCSTVEYGAQVYGAVLNKVQSKEIEGIQVQCLHIILGCESRSYARNLASIEIFSYSMAG